MTTVKIDSSFSVNTDYSFSVENGIAYVGISNNSSRCAVCEQVISAILSTCCTCGCACFIRGFWENRIVRPLMGNSTEMIKIPDEFITCQPTGKRSRMGSPGGYDVAGTLYGADNISAYINYKHGVDGEVILNPIIIEYLDGLAGGSFLDIGCGGGNWAVYAAEKHPDMKVTGIDVQEGMIIAARQLKVQKSIGSKLNFAEGDAANLKKIKSESIDNCASILVGCNLPSALHVMEHFNEAYRVMKEGGEFLFIYPEGIEIAFTSGHKTASDILNDLNAKLKEFNKNGVHTYDNLTDIQEFLKEFKYILKATFYIQNGAVELVTDATVLEEGGKIIRKLGKAIIPNHYYSWDHYQTYIEAAHLKIKKQVPCKLSEQQILQYVTQSQQHRLGIEYIMHTPYGVVILEKEIMADNEFVPIKNEDLNSSSSSSSNDPYSPSPTPNSLTSRYSSSGFRIVTSNV